MLAAPPTLCTALIPVSLRHSPELRDGCAGRKIYTGRLTVLGVTAGQRRYGTLFHTLSHSHAHSHALTHTLTHTLTHYHTRTEISTQSIDASFSCLGSPEFKSWQRTSIAKVSCGFL